MSGYKNFAVAGAGHSSAVIVEELLKLKAEGRVSSVVILTRSGESDELRRLSSLGATLAKVDYTDKDSISTALRKVDVLISTLGGGTLDVQPVMADAAKTSGVKLFVPSEFGHVVPLVIVLSVQRG